MKIVMGITKMKDEGVNWKLEENKFFFVIDDRVEYFNLGKASRINLWKFYTVNGGGDYHTDVNSLRVDHF